MPYLLKSFFQRKTKLVAKELLGKILVRRSNSIALSGIIVETEAYVGSHDLACHTSRGKTNRNQVMFRTGGIWYIYFTYGMHYLLNIVTEPAGKGAAVLIRALEPLEGIDEMKKNRNKPKITELTSGPGKLTQALKINLSLNTTSAFDKSARLLIKDNGIKIPKSKIIATSRIGVDYAKEWKDKPLRFYIKDNKFVSKK